MEVSVNKLKNNFKKLKYFSLLATLIFFFILVSAISYVSAVSANLSNSVFRLHVIANSDSTEDQNLKYIVRDKIIEHVNELGKIAKTKEELIENINLDEINDIAKKTIIENGYDYNVEVEIGNFSFPTKTYGDISLPAGFYDALRVKIGKAEGQNWWCVMFPPLCFVDISSGIVPTESKENLKENLDSEEYTLISDNESEDIKLKFKIVEMLQNIGIAISSNK